MVSNKVHKINIDSFFVGKLTEEVVAIENQIASTEAIKGGIEEKLAKCRDEIEVSERELDEVSASIITLKENRSAIKEKAEIIKKQNN